MIDEVPGLPSKASCDGEAKATVFQPLTVKVDTSTPLSGEDNCKKTSVVLQQPRLLRGSRCRLVTVLTHRQESPVKHDKWTRISV